MLEVLKLLLGLLVLPLLLYVPGATLLNSLAARRPAPHLFSGRDEWLFTAVLASVLTTGLVGFLLAEMGLFRWWTVLALALIFSLLVVVLLGQAAWRWRPLFDMLRLPTPYPQRESDRRLFRLQRLALVVLVLVAAGLFSRSAEMLRGALDSGAYINAGIALGRTGAIFQRDILMRQLNDDVGEGAQLLQGLNPDRYTLDRLRMPAFYVYDKKAALVVPQHYSLYPVWIGLMYSLFGVWGALYATPLLALLLVLAVYFFARRALTPGAALLALALLVLCPVMIWFARYPVSEIIQGLLGFASFFAFLRMMQLAGDHLVTIGGEDRLPTTDYRLPTGNLATDTARQSWAGLWGCIAGVSLGEIALARPDFIFYLAPVPLYLLYWRLARRWRRPYTWFVASLAALLGLYFVYFSIFSFPYTLDLYHNTIINVRRLWAPLLIALYLGVALLIALDRLYPRIRPLWVRAERLAVRYRWLWAGALVLVVGAYAVYHYAVGPWLPNVRFDKAGNPIPQAVTTTWESYIGAPVDQGSKYNLLRVGWYLSPFGMVLGVIGLLRWIWTRLNAATGLFFGCLLAVGLVFIQETFTDPYYIYSMRRYVPLILPALVIGIAWSCQFLWSRVRPRQVGALLAAAAALALAIFFLYTSLPFPYTSLPIPPKTDGIITHVEERGAVAQLSDLASRFPPKSVVLFSYARDEPYVVATPLQYTFGIESFVVRLDYPNVNNAVLENVVKRWQQQGYKVYVMMSANGGKLHFPDLSLKEESTWAYSVPELEQLKYQKPTNISSAYLPWGVYSVQPPAPPPTLPFRIDIGDNDYLWTVGGFYIQEKAKQDTSNWRWTGQQAFVRVPWPSGPDDSLQGGKVTLRLRPETPSAEGKPPLRTQPLTVTLSLDDTRIGQVILPPGSNFADYTLTIPPGLPIPNKGADPGYAILKIESPVWSGEQAGISYDTRRLGVQVDAVEVRR